MKKNRFIGWALIFLVFGMWFYSERVGTGQKVVVVGPTKLFEDYKAEGQPWSVIDSLKGGESGIVLKTRYSKNFMFYKVRFDDGRCGYLMYGEGEYKVIQ